MLIELPVVIENTTQKKLFQSEHILKVEAATGTTINVSLIDGSSISVAMAYEDFKQYAFDSRFAYKYPTGSIPV